MFTNKKKTGNNSDLMRPENRALRMLRSDTSFQASLISLERTDQEDAYDEPQKEVGNAMLEAEYKKAKVIMAMQQHRNFF